MNFVKPKKHLGQHFLDDDEISSKIVNSLHNAQSLLEIGPGMGVLTKYLIEKYISFKAIEIDKESISYLKNHYPKLDLIDGDFLNINLNSIFDTNFSIIGNFPYNISTQIIFKVIENKEKVDQVVGMFQKEVAQRIASKEGSKVYGITSVLTQAFYDVDYLFSVDENSFIPPPKVKSGVIRLKRKEKTTIDCDEKSLFTIVKTSFNQRRKTLRNSLKPFIKKFHSDYDDLFQKRPEQLSVAEFINLTNIVFKNL